MARTTTKIDYSYWARLDKWTVKEAALLFDGKDPSLYPELRLTMSKPPEGFESTVNISRAISRIDWNERFGRSKYEIGSHPVYLTVALMKSGWDIPEGLKAELQKRIDQDDLEPATQNAESEDSSAEREANTETQSNISAATKERVTMLKLILGLAAGGYGLQPEATRNPHAKAMREDLEKIGWGLDDGTIKKYLDEARSLWKQAK